MSKNRWKSNPRRWIGRSSDENSKHGRENVLKRIIDAFLGKSDRNIVCRKEKASQD